jgi:NTE family protein
MTTALVTSGGGAKGAFTVGVLRHLFNTGMGNFDIISGTSTGALLATFACIRDINTLVDVYTSVENDDILTKQNFVNNLRNKRPFIFDSEPLNALIHQKITDAVFQQIMNTNTILCFTAISLQSGKTTIFSTKNIPASPQYEKKLITSRDMFIKALLGSSNQAGFLPPITIDNEQYVDGGNREVLPTTIIPVLRPDRIIAVSNNPRKIERISAPYDDILKVLFRAISIFIQEVRENDMKVLDMYKNQTGADYLIIEPDRDLDPEYPTGLRFDQRAMAAMITKGEITAELILSQNPDFFSLA